jgi:hypothetical protein
MGGNAANMVKSKDAFAFCRFQKHEPSKKILQFISELYVLIAQYCTIRSNVVDSIQLAFCDARIFYQSTIVISEIIRFLKSGSNHFALLLF